MDLVQSRLKIIEQILSRGLCICGCDDFTLRHKKSVVALQQLSSNLKVEKVCKKCCISYKIDSIILRDKILDIEATQ